MVQDEMVLANGGVLEFVVADDKWGSTVSVEADVTSMLGGTLRLGFADAADPNALVGSTFDLFDWNATLDAGERFGAIDVARGAFGWHLGRLYTTGEVALTPAGTGDYDASGLVDQGDLDLVLLHWGSDVAAAPPSVWINDVPAGLVGQAELDGILLHWGDVVPFGAAVAAVAASPVPEPASWGLLEVNATPGRRTPHAAC
jgi:hypothetical protein